MDPDPDPYWEGISGTESRSLNSNLSNRLLYLRRYGYDLLLTKIISFMIKIQLIVTAKSDQDPDLEPDPH
jgi:hypothetical protein